MSKSDPLRVADYLAHIVEAIDRFDDLCQIGHN